MMEVEVKVGEKIVSVFLNMDGKNFDHIEDEKEFMCELIEIAKSRKEEIKELALKEYNDPNFNGDIKIMYDRIWY